MTISRNQMGTQLRSNAMRKQPTAKRRGGGVFGAMDALTGQDKKKKSTDKKRAGGKVGRGDGCCQRGHTKGKMR